MVKSGVLTKGNICGSAIFDCAKLYHRYKEIKDGEIKYGRKVGFDTADEANASCERYRLAFEKEARKLGMATMLDGSMSFLNYLKYFLEEILASRCKLSTYVVYSYSLYDHIIPCTIEDIALKKVNSDYLNKLLNKVSVYTNSSKRKAYEFLALALKQAVVEKRIPAFPQMEKCERNTTELQLFDKEQIRKLLQASSETDWYLEILLALFVGCRKGEILGLKYGDFSKEKGAISIERQIGMSKECVSDKEEKAVKIEKPPKTENSYRTIHVPPLVCREIEKRHEAILRTKEKYGVEYSDNDYLTCQENGESRGLSSINNALAKICERSGLPHATVHSLRHCYASILLEKGYEITVISGILGHSSINTTFEIYAGIIDSDREMTTYINEQFPIGEF